MANNQMHLDLDAEQCEGLTPNQNIGAFAETFKAVLKTLSDQTCTAIHIAQDQAAQGDKDIRVAIAAAEIKSGERIAKLESAIDAASKTGTLSEREKQDLIEQAGQAGRAAAADIEAALSAKLDALKNLEAVDISKLTSLIDQLKAGDALGSLTALQTRVQELADQQAADAKALEAYKSTVATKQLVVCIVSDVLQGMQAALAKTADDLGVTLTGCVNGYKSPNSWDYVDPKVTAAGEAALAA